MSTQKPSNNPTKKVTVAPTKKPLIENKIKQMKSVSNKSKADLIKHKKEGNTLLFLTTLVRTHKNLYKLILCCIISIVLYFQLFK